MPRSCAPSRARNSCWGRKSRPLRSVLRTIAMSTIAARSIAGPRRCIWRCSRPTLGRAMKSLPFDDVRRDHRRDAVQRRQAGLRRRRSGHLDDGSGPDRGRDHAANEGDPACPSARADGRHGSDHGDRPPTRARRHRGRGAGSRRRIQGTARRVDRRFRLLQLLSRQEPRSAMAKAARLSPISRTSRDEFRCFAIGDRKPNTITSSPATITAWTAFRARC